MELIILKINAKESINPDENIKNKYNTVFENVEDKDALCGLIFLIKLFGILDNDPGAVFDCVVYTISGCFGYERNWSIKTKNLMIHLHKHEELSESWQSIETLANELVITGLPENHFIDWDGFINDGIIITIGGIEKVKGNLIIDEGKKLFKTFNFTIQDFNEEDKLRGELKIQHSFNSNIKYDPDNQNIDLLCKMLLEKNEHIPYAAFDRIKKMNIFNKHISKKKFNIIKEGFINVLNEENNDKINWLKKEIADYLGLYGDKRIINILMKGLNGQRDYIEEAFINAIGNIKYYDALDEIFKKCDSQSNDIRWAAASCLHKLINKKNKNKIFDKLLSMIDDASQYVRSAVVGILVQYNDKIFIEPFIKCLKDNYDYIRQTCAYKLGDLGDPKAIPFLKELYENDYNENIRKTINESLAKLEKIKKSNGAKPDSE